MMVAQDAENGFKIGTCKTGEIELVCIRGTRIMVSAVIENVAAGVPRDEILRSYPAQTEADIEAALGYAAELAREGTVDLPLETKAS
jgi:uncharacterized protein (DUF433 family)